MGERHRLSNRLYRMYASEDFKKAIKAVKAGLMTFREAAKYYEVPRTTLQDSLINVLCF